MAKWKLCRQTFGNEEFVLSEGEQVTVGRGLNNTITLSSIVVSRNHCSINVKRDELSIIDLKSSNGVYVGLKKIPSNTPYILNEADVIGFGWTDGAPLAKVKDDEKYVFKLEKLFSPITSRIQFQDNVLDDLEAEIASFDATKTSPSRQSSIFKPKLHLKRKLNIKFEDDEIINKHTLDTKENAAIDVIPDDIINIISDSENDVEEQNYSVKKLKLEPIMEAQTKQDVKIENEDFQYEAFNVKQEYLGYDDEPIEIISDSDSESEHWLRRLSQNSPGKPLKKIEVREKEPESQAADGSYSQLDDVIFVENDDSEEEYMDDLITIPPKPPEYLQKACDTECAEILSKEKPLVISGNHDKSLENDTNLSKNLVNDIQKATTPFTPINSCYDNIVKKEKELEVAQEPLDTVNELNSIADFTKGIENVEEPFSIIQQKHKKGKQIQIIDPLIKSVNKKCRSRSSSHISEGKSKPSHKSSKSNKHSSLSKTKITNSQKEERKKKLKELAYKDKEFDETNKDLANNTNKSVVNVKVTTSNRGAFLSDVVQATIKPTKRKENALKGNDKNKITNKDESKSISNLSDLSYKVTMDLHKKNNKSCENKDTNIKSNSTRSTTIISSDTRISFKSLKPLTERKESYLGKPVSKVEPLPPKAPKKKVSFSELPPKVYEFQIEPGNNMRKTSSVKTTLVDIQKVQLFSLEKIQLITILRWNPHWLIEQLNITEPPPILSHNNLPIAILHSFNSHKDYVKVIGDLLLMEIWECLTQAFNRTRNQPYEFKFRIESCPLTPHTQDNHIQLSNINVNLSLPTSDIKRLPRIGEVMTVDFGPENARKSRFVYVHNLRPLHSPPNNINSFFSISLYVTFTEKMKTLKPGELMIGRTIAYIKNELMLFEAIEYLAGSPLSNAILRPDPYYYPKTELNNKINLTSQWTKMLNPSQKLAVSNSVSAALGDRPSIQMVQGPPGTGKSSVICAIVMTYFYDCSGKKQQNRNKILICATSNAAVDGLVIRLLKIRQSLPKWERFRMVRVGRLDAMHERARDVSSQQLAQRDAARAHADHGHHGLNEEISHLEAKVNMWTTAARDAKGPERAAYCQSRANDILNRISLLRNGSGNASTVVAGERLAQAERRTIEGADIIVTTLASSCNHKMRGLKGRIALCVVDEAGQANEPETLIPLTLDVTKITLIGDPQQLPGFICSQRAKKHGLGESLFSRLTSCSEQWPKCPVVLLNHQYRMQEAIAEYPNRAFYDRLVQSVPPPAVGLDVPPYTVVGISSGDKGQGNSGANEIEAWGVARLAVCLVKKTRPKQLSLAVITPYSAHRDLLRDAVRALQAPSESRVEVNTVDSFQGQERDVVVVSLARSHGVGFLSDAGRMNVMLTRAKHALFVCLNPLAFVKNTQWQTLVDDARNRNVYKTLPNRFCQTTPNASVSCDDVLDCLLSESTSYNRR